MSKIKIKIPKKKLFKKMSKYMVVFCVVEANSFNFIESRIIKPNTTTIKYDDKHTFVVDLENPTFRDGNIRYFCIDINSKQIHFEQLEETESVSSRINAMVMSDSIIEQLVRATTISPKTKFDIIALIVGMVIGGLAGFIIKIFIPIGVV